MKKLISGFIVIGFFFAGCISGFFLYGGIPKKYLRRRY